MKQVIMHLAEVPFNAIASGIKKVEIRLNDAKRQMVQVGDNIVFILYSDNATKLTRCVARIEHFASFVEAYAKYPAEQQYEVSQYYPPAEIEDLGVVVFGLK